MKKILILLLPIFLYAEAFLVSDIPLPKTYIFNLDPYPCDEVCMQQYLDNGMVFSFLAYAQENPTQAPSLQEAKTRYISVLNIGNITFTKNIKIAMLLPYKRIGKYATSTTNAVFAYLIARNLSFDLESFQINSESTEEIANILEIIRQKGYRYIIAPLTLQGAQNIMSIESSDMKIFIPTIHKNDLQAKENFYFGAIDYKEQSKLLLEEATSPLIIFYDKSPTGRKLTLIQEELFLDTNNSDTNETLEDITEDITQRKVIKFPIASRTTNLKNQLFENEELNDGSVILDTPLVKSGMIMSQLTLYDVNTTNILSTQINYNPLLLSITQYEDRKNMIIANSITKNKSSFIEANALLSNDIVYDWINYSTTIGVDLFVSMITQTPRKYEIPLQDNQLIYPIELKRPTGSRFVTYKEAKKIFIPQLLKEPLD